MVSLSYCIPRFWRPWLDVQAELLATIRTCSVKKSVNFFRLAFLCVAKWFFMALFIAFKSGTTRISKPQAHLIIGMRVWFSTNLLVWSWGKMKFVSWLPFFFMIISLLREWKFIVVWQNLLTCCRRGTVTTASQFMGNSSYLCIIQFILLQ